MNFINIVLLVIFVVILYFLYFKEKQKGNNNIWMYWENRKGTQKPKYLNLCYKTVLKNCSQNFNIYLLNENTIYNFLPKLRKDIFEKLNIPQKTDYIRLKLLYKYGGIWLDSDIIVLNDLSSIVKHLNDHDFVGFGCHYRDCKNSGYPKPANWTFAAKKKSILFKECIERSNKLLDKNNKDFFKKNYHILGRMLLWDTIEFLKKTKSWNYYHYDSKCIERDSNYKKLENKRLISNENIDMNCKELLFVPIYNTAPGFPKWFLNMSEEEHLKSNTLFSKFIRKALQD